MLIIKMHFVGLYYTNDIRIHSYEGTGVVQSNTTKKRGVVFIDKTTFTCFGPIIGPSSGLE